LVNRRKCPEDGCDGLNGRHDPDQFLALGPEVQAEYASTKANDRDDVVRKHIKKVGAVSVDFTFARACASAIDTRAKTAGKAT
jgi:hypothetical protein